MQNLILASLSFFRCGRTDKGVSAFSQVVSLTVRSALKYGIGVEPPQINESNENLLKDGDMNEELNYPSILNRGWFIIHTV